MSTIIITGRETVFKGIPLPILQIYQPGMNTHYAIWRNPDPEVNLFLCQYLRILLKIKAIDRLHILDLDNASAALFDKVSSHSTILEDLERMLRILCNTQFILENPYRIASHQEYAHLASEDFQHTIELSNTEKRLGIKLRPDGWEDVKNQFNQFLEEKLSKTVGAHDGSLDAIQERRNKQ